VLPRPKINQPHAIRILIRVTQQLGGLLGTAVLTVVLQRALTGAHTSAALAHGFQQSFWWAVIFTAIAVLVSLLLPGKPKPAQPQPHSALGQREQVSETA
jgi:hypothetical protein